MSFPRPLPPIDDPDALLQSVYARCERDDDGHLIQMTHLTQGRGRTWLPRSAGTRRRVYSARLVFELEVRPLVGDEQVHHRLEFNCPLSCVEITHLVALTDDEHRRLHAMSRSPHRIVPLTSSLAPDSVRLCRGKAHHKISDLGWYFFASGRKRCKACQIASRKAYQARMRAESKLAAAA